MNDDNLRIEKVSRPGISGQVWTRLFKAGGWLAIGVGCLPLTLGLWNIVAIVAFNATAVRAEATVTSVPSGYGGLRFYFPCRYDREQGTVVVEHYKQERRAYISRGQKVSILYQPTDPMRARLDVPRPYFWPGFFVVAGLFFIGFGWVFSRFLTLFGTQATPRPD